MMTGDSPRRCGRRSGAFIVALTAVLIGGCAAKTSATGTADTAGTAGTADTLAAIVADAPVAAATDLPAGSAMAAIHAAGVLNVGGVETAALFSLKDPTTGKVSGFDADLAQLLARYLTGRPDVKLTVVSSQTREQVLENGTVDAVFATYSITPARAARVAFAGPYYNSPLGIGVATSDTTIRSAADLAGRDVCVQANSTAVPAVTAAAPTAHQLLLDTNNECLEALRQGRVNAYVVDEALLIGAEAKSHDIKVRPFGQSDLADPYGIGLPKDKPELKTFVNDWLKKIVAVGIWARVWKLTIGTVVEGPAPVPPAIGSAAGS
jgi:glutamate transport system substrate-binding protein